MGYQQTAIKSFSWVTAFRVFYRLLAFLRTAILARLLLPQEFGEFGVAALVLALVEMLTETGINVFLVQQEEEKAINKYINTAWVVSILRGITISVVVAAASPLVADFFNAPAARNLLLLIALVPLVRGFINPAVAKFQKHLRFDKEFLIRASYTVVDTIVTLSAAFITKSPSSLVFGLLASALSEAILTWLLVLPRPHFKFSRSHFGEIISSGKWVTGAGILAYFANNSADTSIGKLLGTGALGFYQMSYKVSVLFVDELTELVNRVAFPVYVKIIGDQTRLRRAFYKTAGLYTLIGLFGMACLYFIAPLVIPIFLGPRWSGIIPIVRLLILMGVAIIFSASTNPLFLAAKKQHFLTASIFNQLIAIAIGLILVFRHPSVENIILVVIFSMFATLPLRFYLAYSILWKPRNRCSQPLAEPHKTPASATIITTTYQGTPESF